MHVGGRSKPLGITADEQRLRAGELAEGGEERRMVLLRIDAGDVRDQVRGGRDAQFRAHPGAENGVGAKALGVDSIVDQLAPAGPEAQVAVRGNAGFGIEQDRIGPGREPATGSNDPPQAPAIAGEVHVRAAHTPDQPRAAPAAGDCEREGGKELGVVHPSMEDMRPVTADQAGQPQEREEARAPPRHAEVVYRDARALDHCTVCTAGQKTDHHRASHAPVSQRAARWRAGSRAPPRPSPVITCMTRKSRPATLISRTSRCRENRNELGLPRRAQHHIDLTILSSGRRMRPTAMRTIQTVRSSESGMIQRLQPRGERLRPGWRTTQSWPSDQVPELLEHALAFVMSGQ